MRIGALDTGTALNSTVSNQERIITSLCAPDVTLSNLPRNCQTSKIVLVTLSLVPRPLFARYLPEVGGAQKFAVAGFATHHGEARCLVVALPDLLSTR